MSQIVLIMVITSLWYRLHFKLAMFSSLLALQQVEKLLTDGSVDLSGQTVVDDDEDVNAFTELEEEERNAVVAQFGRHLLPLFLSVPCVVKTKVLRAVLMEARLGLWVSIPSSNILYDA